MKTYKLIFSMILCCAFVFVNHGLVALEEVRAAIDFGSGAVKYQVGIVDTDDNKIVGEPLLIKQVSLNLTEDVAANGGSISEAMEKQGMIILSALKDEAQVAASQIGQSDVKFAGIATAVFRKAPNGPALLQRFEDELGIHFQILSQEEEGVLGYMTAKVLYPEVPEEDIIAWDNGNGSFQLTGKVGDAYTRYQGPTGYGTVRVILSKDIRNGAVLQPHESGNPVSVQECDELARRVQDLLSPTPAWIMIKLASEKTIVVTYGNSVTLFGCLAESKLVGEGIQNPSQEVTVNRADLKKMIGTYMGKPDAVFDAVGIYNRTLTAAVYALTLMEHLGIEVIHYKKTIGNTSALLIYTPLWEQQLKTAASL